MNRVLEILKKTGAVMTDGHFVGVSGRHFDLYVNKDALLPHTQAVSEICQMFAQKYQNLDLDIVVGPALGGIFLSQWTAYHLSQLKGREILSLYTEKTPDNQQNFTRGNDKLVRGKKALILEDCVTTGASVMKVVKAVEQAEGQVAAVCVMVNKDPENIHLDSLTELPVKTYAPENCPLCQDHIPINMTVGHGKKFYFGKLALRFAQALRIKLLTRESWLFLVSATATALVFNSIIFLKCNPSEGI